jgi:tetratricopeptide (TPR) repeat protein
MYDPLMPVAGGSEESIPCFVSHSYLEEKFDNPLEAIQRVVEGKFGFGMVTSSTYRGHDDARDKIVQSIRDSALVIVVLDDLKPNVTFEYGIASASDKVTVLVKEERSEVDISQFFPEGRDEFRRGGVQAFAAPGAEFFINYKSDETDRLVAKLTREIILHREKISETIRRMNLPIPLTLYLQFLSYLDGYEKKAILNEALSVYPEDDQLWQISGNIKIQERDFEGAYDDYDKAIEINPDNPQLYLNRGAIFLDTGEFDRAIVDFDRVIELKPAQPDAHFNKGNILLFSDNYEEAFEEYERAVDLKPDFTMALNNMANLMNRMGRYDRAIEYIDRCIRYDPDYPFPYLNLAISYANKRRDRREIVKLLRKAEALCRKNVEIDREVRKSTYCMFCIYTIVGLRDLAIKYLRKCADFGMPLRSWQVVDRIDNPRLRNDPEVRDIVLATR